MGIWPAATDECGLPWLARAALVVTVCFCAGILLGAVIAAVA